MSPGHGGLDETDPPAQFGPLLTRPLGMIPADAIALILESEGLDQPDRWPGGASGITIGHGYDLGYTTAAEFARDWSEFLAPKDVARLRTAIGRKGPSARAAASSFKGIRITPSAAAAVFARATLPKWEKTTRKIFPGIELLPEAVLGALTSLVFNRGPSLVGDRRREMRQIRDTIRDWSTRPDFARRASQSALLHSIAAQIRAMKRLWIGQGLDGLLTRREREAAMVERAT